MSDNTKVESPASRGSTCLTCESWIPPGSGVPHYHPVEVCNEAKRGRESFPVGLHDWFMAHRLKGSDLLCADAAEAQVMFVRDELPKAAAPIMNFGHPWKYPDNISYEEMRRRAYNSIAVISAHKSKSCLLPVYEIDYIPGVVVTFRGNFHDWKVSIKSETEVKERALSGLVAPERRNEVYSPVYLEGFPDNRCYGSYANNARQFTIEIGGRYELWSFFREVAVQVTERCRLRKEQI